MSRFFVHEDAVFANPLTLTGKDVEGTHVLPLAKPAERPSKRQRHILSLQKLVAEIRSSGHIVKTLMFLVLALSVATSAYAQETTVSTVTDDQVNAIAEKLYCPVCENITLDTCGTAACADWRYEIRLQLEQGKTEAEIIEDFVRRFGDRVVGTPLDPTLRAISLYTPWLLVAVGLIGAGIVLAQRRSKAQLATANGTTAPDAQNRYADLFEQDLSG